MGGNHSTPAAGVPEIVLRPMASPQPLGFFAFGIGTMLLTALEVGWVPITQGAAVSIILLAFVAPLELSSALLSYPARDVGAATSFGILGALWASIGVLSLVSPPGSTSPAEGIFLIVVAPAILALAGAITATKPVFAGLLLLAAARFVVTGVYQVTAARTLEMVSGWMGIPLALVSVYGGLALLMEDARGHTVLPMGRFGSARVPMEGGLRDQLAGIEQEAGVRRQL